MTDETRRIFDGVISTLVAAIEARDPVTGSHSKRVAAFSLETGKQLGLSEKDMEVLRVAALLHDYGKIAVREAILTKDGRLTEEEYEHIKEHVIMGSKMLQQMCFPEELKDVLTVIHAHHECFDGTGYPDKLKEDEIPLAACVVKLADAFDALTFKRHDRDPMPIDRVLKIIEWGQGSQFNPLVVKGLFLCSVVGILEIIRDDLTEGLRSEDREYLHGFSMMHFFEALKEHDHQRTDEQKQLVDCFGHYYDNRQQNLP